MPGARPPAAAWFPKAAGPATVEDTASDEETPVSVETSGPTDTQYFSTYTPVNSLYPMSWSPRGCDWCDNPDIVWAYSAGQVVFLRQLEPGKPKVLVPHVAQPWFVCARCKAFVGPGRWQELAEELGLAQVPEHWRAWQHARMPMPGYAWKPGRNPRRDPART